jgi:antitoxin YefM
VSASGQPRDMRTTPDGRCEDKRPAAPAVARTPQVSQNSLSESSTAPASLRKASDCCAALGASAYLMTIIQVMTVIPLADAKARLSAVLDEVRDTHDRVVITRNGRPEAVIMSLSDLEALEETLDLLSTPGALDEIRVAEAEIARGEAIGADELRRLMEQRMRAEQGGE